MATLAQKEKEISILRLTNAAMEDPGIAR